MLRLLVYGVAIIAVLFSAASSFGQNFHGAPESAKELKNPFEGSEGDAQAGKPLYHKRCARCHGETGAGSGNIPPLRADVIRKVTPGEVFWFITKGDPKREMPSWAELPATERWKIVSYVKSEYLQKGIPARASAGGEVKAASLKLPALHGPFTDFRHQTPGEVRKITVADLPQPFATKSSDNGPDVVARPRDAWPKARAGFKVDLYAAGLQNPRMLRTAPNGDIFLAESDAGRVRVFRGMGSDGKPEQMQVFAGGMKNPYGIAFYPPGPEPQWVYIGCENEVVRFPYKNGDMAARGRSEHLLDLPTDGHWTRSVEFSPDAKTMFVAVGSRSNVDDPDTTPDEKNRAVILAFSPDGKNQRVYAYGIRNAGGGLAVSPKTGELWCSVNERDALGENLVPDYVTHVQEGGFYGWPWWYMGAHQDPRHKGKHPELKDKTIVPDVLLQPHNASLGITFYQGKQFPAEYQGDIFAGQHGSWNKSARAGYEVIRVPLHQSGRASGEYEDFLTGFVLDNGDVWGRPVAVTVAPDGSLLVSDDGSNSIWRVSYVGK
jgi:glucose/arabinose dehydrogenase/mono/diheme cytochrome c family protein